MKALILNDRKFPYAWASLIIILFVGLDALDWHNTFQSKVILGILGLLGAYVEYVKYQHRKEQGLPILSWQLILPLALVVLIITYSLWSR